MKIEDLLETLNKECENIINQNGDLKTELTETKKRLFNALVKLDRIKLITNDIRIKEILEEL